MRVKRLRPKPPEPTPDNPYAQLDWLLELYLRRVPGRASRDTLRVAIGSYKRFFHESHEHDNRHVDNKLFYLSKHFHHFTLYDVEKYWRARGLSSYTIRIYFFRLRTFIHFAAKKGYTLVTEFVEPSLVQGERETKMRTAYEEEEMEFILRAIRPAIKYATQVLAGYKKTGVGGNLHAGQNDQRGPEGGWKGWEKMVWYFENILQCRPLPQKNPVPKEFRQFFHAATTYHGGIQNVWRKLGVTPLIDRELIVPLVVKLAAETGMNPDSVISLKRDCYRETHPLFNYPYIRYYKERSTGEKDLHLVLYGDANVSPLPLLPKQAEIIRRTIEIALKLTEPLVDKAAPEDRDYLFLLQPRLKGGSHGRDPNRVVRLNRGYVREWANSLKKDAKKKGAANVPDILTLARFRPTKITQMVREGHDFFRIQAVAGHASPSTTEKYIESHRLAPQAQREISAVLRQIHQNKQEFEKSPKPYATSSTQPQDGVIYKGVMCDCKNVLDPPDSVKRLPGFKQGQPCTYWNMCLLCPNVLITKKHLPVLASYDSQVKASLESNNLSHAPNATLYYKISAVLDGIFREFPEDEVTWARKISECIDVHIDPITYRAVLE